MPKQFLQLVERTARFQKKVAAQAAQIMKAYFFSVHNANIRFQHITIKCFMNAYIPLFGAWLEKDKFRSLYIFLYFLEPRISHLF